MDWTATEWGAVQAETFGNLLAGAIQAVILEPAKRYGPRVNRERRRHTREIAKLEAALPGVKAQLASQLATLRSRITVGWRDPPTVVEQLETFFASAPLDTLIRQSVAARLAEPEADSIAHRLHGSLSAAIWSVSPTAYVLKQELVPTIAQLIAVATDDLLRRIDLPSRDYTDPSINTRVLESCRWQLDAIERFVELAAQPAIRVDTLKSFAERYRQALELTLEKMPTPHWDAEPRVPIRQVYVPPRFTEGEPFAEPGEERAIVLGDPGAGKTAFACFLAYQLVGEEGTVTGRARTPFIISLREYRQYALRSDGGASFVDYIVGRCAEMYQVRPVPAAIEFLLLSGEGMVIFDGLDEILSLQERREVALKIEVFCQLFPNAPILVTSRLNGYENAPLDESTFAVYTISPFDSSDISRYVTSWFALDEALPPGLLDQQRHAFLDSIASLDRSLYSNPLTLALLCNLYKATGYAPLPKSRAEVYEKCSLMLYHRWDQRRGIGDVDFERDFLPVIAFAADRIMGDPTLEVGFTRRRLLRLCLDFLVPSKFEEEAEAVRYGQSLIDHCVGRAWVFSAVDTSAHGGELFHFTHRTFLEYFAAVHLVRTNASASQLADSLMAWIALDERRVITQMAFEIKTRHLDEAAEEFCLHLLEAMGAMNTRERATTLNWLSDEAVAVPIGQSVLRQIVHLVLRLPAQERISCVRRLASARGENRRVVDQTVRAFVKERLSSEAWIPQLRAVVKSLCAERTSQERKQWEEILGVPRAADSES